MEFEKEKEWEEELRRIRKRIPLEPNNPELLLEGAKVARLLAKHTEAIVYSKKALDRAVRDRVDGLVVYRLEYCHNLSNCCHYSASLGLLKELAETLEKEEHPRKQWLIWTYYLIGVAYFKMRSRSKAQTAFAQSLRLFGEQTTLGIYDNEFYDEAFNFIIEHRLMSMYALYQEIWMKSFIDLEYSKTDALKFLQDIFKNALTFGGFEFIFDNFDYMLVIVHLYHGLQPPWIDEYLKKLGKEVNRIPYQKRRDKFEARLKKLHTKHFPKLLKESAS